MNKKLRTIAPGEILLEEFLIPMGVSQNQLARDIDVAVSRVSGIVTGKRAITAETAMRLARYFGTSPEMWLNLQTEYDLRVLRRTKWPDIEPRIRPYSADTIRP